MKDLRKLADQVLDKQKINKYRNLFIDAMLSFHEQASKDMFTTDDMLGFAEHCRLTEVLPTCDNLNIWLAIKDNIQGK